jgi:perosamine synthetase
MKRIGALEKKYVSEVLSSEFRGSKSKSMVLQAEKLFAKEIGVDYAIGFVNGTSTLHIALEALGVGVGDEVIVPPLTMSATAFAVLHSNATPVFVDVDPLTWQISSQSIRNKISDKTKAIITVALYGGSPDYDAIKNIAPNIPIIEDNAEAFGTKYKKKNIGKFGVFSSYSFQSSKQLSAGEGGMLCTNSLELADKARKLQSLGYLAVGAKVQKIDKRIIQAPDYSRHEILGWNYRMSELTAAVVKAQIERCDQLLAIRKEIGESFFELAENSRGLLTTQKIYPNSTHSFWAAPVLLDINKVKWDDFRNKFLEFGGNGIYSAWKLSYLEPVFSNMNILKREQFITKSNLEEIKNAQCPVAQNLQPRILAFRTNEWTLIGRKTQLKALKKTIEHFNK